MGHVPVVGVVPDLILALVVEPVAFPELGEQAHHALLAAIGCQAAVVGLALLADLLALLALALLPRALRARAGALRRGHSALLAPAWVRPGAAVPLVVTAIHRRPLTPYVLHCCTCARS